MGAALPIRGDLGADNLHALRRKDFARKRRWNRRLALEYANRRHDRLSFKVDRLSGHEMHLHDRIVGNALMD